MKSEVESKSRPLTIRGLSEANLGALQQLAAQNERSLEGEARYAIRTHLETRGKESIGFAALTSALNEQGTEGNLKPAPKDSRQAEVERTEAALDGLEMKLASLSKRVDDFTDAASLMAGLETRIMDQRIALYALDRKHPRGICEALL
jgi:plasmid stability protein